MKRHIGMRWLALLLALLLSATAATAEELEVALAGEDPAVVDGDGIALPEEGAYEVEGELAELVVEEAPDPEGAVEAAPNAEPLDYLLSDDGLGSVAEPIVLGVKEKYTLEAASLEKGAGFTYWSSRPGVASVSAKGVVTAKKKGTTRINCCAEGEVMFAYEVTVVSAPKKISLGMKSVTLGVGETLQVEPTIPRGSHASFAWSSGDKAIASVSAIGLIKGRSPGRTRVRVKTQNGKKASLKVKVVGAPGMVTLNKTVVKLYRGDAVRLKATLPKGTASQLTWSSSDEGIATVDSDGRVTAVADGRATISVSTFNGKRATCIVNVGGKAPDGVTTYRALLIGEEKFTTDTCPRNRGDVVAMSKMLKTVRGPEGGAFKVTRKYDLSRELVLKAISDTFADADEDDVSLFFIATHGAVNMEGAHAGELAMAPEGDLMMQDLADALNRVPGKVIVLLESCGSGSAVYEDRSRGTGYSAEQLAIAFDEAAVRAFASVDDGVEEWMDEGVSGANTGELRLAHKFYVLTASRHQELSFGYEYEDPKKSFNYFTRWLIRGVGRSGAMPADTNGDGRTSLNEMYQYISSVGDNYPLVVGSVVYYQHVQVYPANSSFPLFAR